MAEHPILMSAPMVRAIQDNKKTQTRRPVTASNSTVCGHNVSKGKSLWTGLQWDDRVFVDRSYSPGWEYLHVPWIHPEEGDDGRVFRVRSKYEPGDRLWIKEAFEFVLTLPPAVLYRADQNVSYAKWRPSIFMPRWASRITLEITGVRVQHIQEVSEEDAIAEGCSGRQEFRVLWDVINFKRGYGWEANPFVWVLEFERVNEIKEV